MRSLNTFVKGLGKIGGSDHDDSLVLREAIKLDQELVEGHPDILLVLWVSGTTDGINFVNKNNAG